MSNVPNWWEFSLLALAAWRLYRLLAEDTVLDRPRRKLVRLADDWQQEGDDPGPSYRSELGLFITCPYCAGFWVAVAWWVAWLLWPHATLVVAVPLAISAVVALLAKGDERLNSG